jgi:hypothetical protein
MKPYSTKEIQLMEKLGYGDFIYQEPAVTYRTLAIHCFVKNLSDPLADSVRRCYIAMQEGNPYRLTEDFDNLITLD